MADRWYVVHTNTGFEDRVKSYIEDRIVPEGFQDQVYEVLVPTETIVEPVKGGKKKTSGGLIGNLTRPTEGFASQN